MAVVWTGGAVLMTPRDIEAALAKQGIHNVTGLVNPKGMNAYGVTIFTDNGEPKTHIVTGCKDPMEAIPLLAEWIRDKRGEYDYLDVD